MNLKKIGLTALAGSLVATSLVAGEMAVTGSASMKVRHVDGEGDLHLREVYATHPDA